MLSCQPTRLVLKDVSDVRGSAGGLRTGRSQIQLYLCDHLGQQVVVDPLTCR